MQKTTGFTLIELMIVVAIIAVVATIAVPNLMSSRIAANEAAAISTMRTIQTAQGQFRSQQYMDDDADGVGEYAFLAELAGTVPLNLRTNGNGSPNPLDPSVLHGPFRFVIASRVSASGYFFQLYLPDAAGAGVPEAALGGPTGAENADWSENYWNVYAYPVDAHQSGNRTFCVSERGEIRQTRMDVLEYDSVSVPAWNAAYVNALGNMMDAFGTGASANDGNNWVTVQ